MTNKVFKTKISETHENAHVVFGYPVTELMATHTFTEVIFLLYAGKLPTEAEAPLLDALLVAAAEHGVETPSLYMPRVSVSSGNSVHVGMAAGILGLGEAHGGAGEAAALLLSRKENAAVLVEEYAKDEKRMPGFGHMHYKEEDPRATVIYKKAKDGKLPLEFFEKAYEIEELLAKKKGKKLPLNIDGAFAAAVLALGMPPAAAKALFVLARVAGMGAHALEELEQRNPYRRLEG